MASLILLLIGLAQILVNTTPPYRPCLATGTFYLGPGSIVQLAYQVSVIINILGGHEGFLTIKDFPKILEILS